MTISKDGRMNSIKTIVIIISLFVFLIAPANAVVSLKTKDGKILRWKNYTEEGSDYCTMSSAGKFCIPKILLFQFQVKAKITALKARKR